MTVELVLSSLGCALLCYSLGRYNRALTLQRWQFVLNAPERQAIESLRHKMALDSAWPGRPWTRPAARTRRAEPPTRSPSCGWRSRSWRRRVRTG